MEKFAFKSLFLNEREQSYRYVSELGLKTDEFEIQTC